MLTAAGVASGAYRSGDMEQARETLEDMYSVGPADAFLRLTGELLHPDGGVYTG